MIVPHLMVVSSSDKWRRHIMTDTTLSDTALYDTARHNVLFGQFFPFRPSKVRPVVKFHGHIAIKHIFIPARSIERKIKKIGFS